MSSKVSATSGTSVVTGRPFLLLSADLLWADISESDISEEILERLRAASEAELKKIQKEVAEKKWLAKKREETRITFLNEMSKFLKSHPEYLDILREDVDNLDDEAKITFSKEEGHFPKSSFGYD